MGGEQTFLAFVWTPGGYELHERHGELPRVGETVDWDGRRWNVIKVAPSPLPNDRRTCAYLQA